MSDRFAYVLNIESRYLETHDHRHNHLLHRKDCSYFMSPGVVEELPQVTGEVASEWFRQYMDRPADDRLIDFCDRCIVDRDGELREPFAGRE